MAWINIRQMPPVDYKPSADELDSLRKCIGKEVGVLVHTQHAEWRYEEPAPAFKSVRYSSTSVSYKMVLDKVEEDRIEGRLCSDEAWGKKGCFINQKFLIESRLPWEEDFKTVKSIGSAGEVLYGR